MAPWVTWSDSHTHLAWLHAWPDQTRTHPPRMAPRVTWLDLHKPTTYGSLRDLIRLANTDLAWLHAWPDQTRKHPPHMAPCVTWSDSQTPTSHGSTRDLIRLANTHLAWLLAWPYQTCTHPPSVTSHIQHCSALWVPLSKQAIILFDFFSLIKYFFFNRAHDF